MTDTISRYIHPDTILAAAAQSTLGESPADDLDAWFHHTWLNLEAYAMAQHYFTIDVLKMTIPMNDQLQAQYGEQMAILTDPEWLKSLQRHFALKSDLDLVLFLYKGLYFVSQYHHLHPDYMDFVVKDLWDTIFVEVSPVLRTRGIDLHAFVQMTHLHLQPTFSQMYPMVVRPYLETLFPLEVDPYARAMAIAVAPVYTLLSPEKLDALRIAMPLSDTFAQAWSRTVQCTQQHMEVLSL